MIFEARQRLEDEEYRDISSPKRSVEAKNHASESRNEVLGQVLNQSNLKALSVLGRLFFRQRLSIGFAFADAAE